MNVESRFLVSDSIRDEIHQEPEENIDESIIPILALFHVGEKEGIVTILRSVESTLTQVKFSFSCNCSDSLNIFSNFEAGDKKQFDAAVIEYKNKSNQFDLRCFELCEVRIRDIDSDKQTSICEVLFTRDNI